MLVCKRQKVFSLTTWIPETHQRWINVETTLIVNVHRKWKWKWKLSNVETTLIELHRFKVGEPTLFQHWDLVENESWANVCLSTWFQRWQNNVETTLIELSWLNVDDPMFFSMLVLGWKGKLSQHIFIGVEKTALKQLCQYFLYWGSLESGSIIKQN